MCCEWDAKKEISVKSLECSDWAGYEMGVMHDVILSDAILHLVEVFDVRSHVSVVYVVCVMMVYKRPA